MTLVQYPWDKSGTLGYVRREPGRSASSSTAAAYSSSVMPSGSGAPVWIKDERYYLDPDTLNAYQRAGCRSGSA